MKKQNARRADGYVAVEVSWNNESNGKRERKVVYGETQKEANEKANVLRAMHGKGIDLSAQKDTFGSWAERWLSLKKNEVSVNWYLTLQSSLKHFERIDATEIGKLKSIDFQSLIYQLAAEKHLAQKTLKTIKSIALQIYALAIDNRVLDYNPIVNVKIPFIQSLNDRRALSEEERRWIIDTPHRAQTPAMIMLFAGLRRGEMIPLTWADIDLKNKTINVNKFVEMIKGQSLLKDFGKSSSAKRVVYIPQILAEYLGSLKRENLFICTSSKGEMLSESAYTRMWESYVAELNLKYGDWDNCSVNKPKSKFAPKSAPRLIPNITAHWLRHSFATMLYMAGVDVLTAKEQLGHSDIKTTLNIYTHLDGLYKIKTLSKLDDYLSEKKTDASIMPV